MNRCLKYILAQAHIALGKIQEYYCLVLHLAIACIRLRKLIVLIRSTTPLIYLPDIHLQKPYLQTLNYFDHQPSKS